MTEKFIMENPILVLMILGGAFALIKLLVMIISKLVTQPFTNLTGALTGLSKAVDDIREDIKANRKEAKEDRKEDQKDIGSLLDRMQAQETLCEVTRQFCPHGKGEKCGQNAQP